MSSHIVKERMGLPIWDGDMVVGIKHFTLGQTITTEDFEEARQDSDEQEMLIQYNCFTDEELSELEAREEQQKIATASVSDANEALPSQEDH